MRFFAYWQVDEEGNKENKLYCPCKSSLGYKRIVWSQATTSSIPWDNLVLTNPATSEGWKYSDVSTDACADNIDLGLALFRVGLKVKRKSSKGINRLHHEFSNPINVRADSIFLVTSHELVHQSNLVAIGLF